MLDDVLGDGIIKRRDVAALLVHLSLMVASALLLWLTNGR